MNVVGAGNTAPGRDRLLPERRLVHRLRLPRFQLRGPRHLHDEEEPGSAASRREPMVQMLDLSMIKYAGGARGPEVPSQAERQEYARKQKEEGEYKKWTI